MTVLYYGLRLSAPRFLAGDYPLEHDFLEARLLVERLRPEDRVLVAGHGRGSVAAMIACKIGARRITSYEPNEDLVRRATGQVFVDGLALDPIMAALDVRTGEAEFYVRENWAASSLYPWTPGEDATRRVPTIEINQALRQAEATVLSLDVEGAEWELLPMIDHPPLRLIVAEMHFMREWVGKWLADKAPAFGFRVRRIQPCYPEAPDVASVVVLER